jgi:hypothetical protein
MILRVVECELTPHRVTRQVPPAVELARNVGTVVAHTEATNEHPPGGRPGSEMFEPPGQEPPLGGRGGQLERPAVRRLGLGVTAETPQQLAAGRVEVEVAVQVEAVDGAQRRGGVAGLGDATARLSSTTGEPVSSTSRRYVSATCGQSIRSRVCSDAITA